MTRAVKNHKGQSFPSIKAAAAFVNGNSVGILQAIQQGCTYRGALWFYKENPVTVPDSCRLKKIVITKCDDNLVKEFNTTAEAALFIGTNRSRLCKAIRNVTPCKGFYVFRVDPQTKDCAS